MLRESELEHGIGEAAEVELLCTFDFSSCKATLVGGEVGGTDSCLELVQHSQWHRDADLLETEL